MSGAASGLRVVDFSRFLPGPYCTWMLADLGAEVVRVEHPRELAKHAQIFGWDKLSESERIRIRARDIFGRNKRSLLIDPGAEASRPVLRELIRRADVLVEDYRPGVLGAMGFGYAAMAELNSRLIYCSITLCGQTGPYRDKPGHDPIALALAGTLSRIGEDSDKPVLAGVPIADLLSGSNAVIGILAALREREQTGLGQQVDIAMSDSCMALIATTISRFPDLDRIPSRGNQRTEIGIYRTADGRLIVTTDMEPQYWRRFCDAMNCPQFAPLQRDPSSRDMIKKYLAEAFAKRPLKEWLDLLQRAGTQFAPVHSIAEALADPHNIARGMSIIVETPAGSVRQIGSPIKLSRSPEGPPCVPAHAPGSDNEALFRELGFPPPSNI